MTHRHVSVWTLTSPVELSISSLLAAKLHTHSPMAPLFCSTEQRKARDS
jgi:hypothetical protein